MRLLMFLSVLIVSGIYFNVNGQSRYLAESDISPAITRYVKTHFSENKIVSVKHEKTTRKEEYEIRLDNYIELSFDSTFAIKEIEGKQPLPQSVIPQKIWQYVTTKFPNNKILEWKRKKSSIQKVELDNELELYFDAEGNFLRADD